MKKFALLLAVLLGIGCATSGVAKPVTAPALLGDDDLIVASGQYSMLRTLSGATVVANGQTTLTNDRGVAAFVNLPVGADLDLSASDHLRLETRYRGRASLYFLWPLLENADRKFVQEFAFSFDGGHLHRFTPNATVYLVPVGEMHYSAVGEQHRLAGERLTAITHGQVIFVVTDQPPVNSIFLFLKLNPKMDKKYAATTMLEFYGDEIVGGVIQYRSLKFAQNSQIINHEMTHAAGVGHVKGPGLMNATPYDFEELAPWERPILANMYRFPVGTTLKGNVINDRNINPTNQPTVGFGASQRRSKVRKVSCQLPVMVMAEPRHTHR